MQQPPDQPGHAVTVAQRELPVDRRRHVDQAIDAFDAALADYRAVGFEDAVLAIERRGQLDGPAVGAHLQRPALQQIDLVAIDCGKIRGELDIDRVVVGLLEQTEHLAHVADEGGLREQLVEGEDQVGIARSFAALLAARGVALSPEAKTCSGRPGAERATSTKSRETRWFASKSIRSTLRWLNWRTQSRSPSGRRSGAFKATIRV